MPGRFCLPTITIVGLFLCLNVRLLPYLAVVVPPYGNASYLTPATGLLAKWVVRRLPFFMPLSVADGVFAKSLMLHSCNCRATMPGTPAQAAPLQSDKVQSLLNHFFTSSIEVQNLRRDVRRWSLANVMDWDENFGSNLPEQIPHYEVRDELLHEIAVSLTQNAASK